MTGTDGSPEGTSGASRRFRLDRRDRIGLATVASATLMVAIINALTVVDDLTRAGIAVAPWEPWIWELSSAAFWILIGLPLIHALRRLRPPQMHLAVVVATILLLSIPVCALHLSFLAGSRAAAYALIGHVYHYDWSWGQIIYEWRKDLLSLVIFAFLSFAIDRLSADPLHDPALDISPFRFEVRDGSRTRWFTALQIERVEAAGNYVELHTVDGTFLHRATLAAVEAQLADHGFSRIHRSRLVRREAITAIVTTAAGDFEATLASGASVGGSRRFRSNLG